VTTEEEVFAVSSLALQTITASDMKFRRKHEYQSNSEFGGRIGFMDFPE
jgi:hypothetical protein